MSQDRNGLAAWLGQAVETVRDLEARAGQAVSGEGGQAAYEALMREKAMFLASLAEEGRELAQESPDVMERLERFSASAQSSLSVGSVFFMSALLYPEDHRPGQENDLEILAKQVRKKQK